MTANRDSTVEAKEVEVNITFENKYNTNIAALESKFEMSYNQTKLYDTLASSTLNLANIFNIFKAYGKKA